jgi:hypothetical protein
MLPIDNAKGSTHMSNVFDVRHRLYSDAMRNPRLVAFGLWLRAGFVGASASAGSAVALFTGEGNPLSMMAIALAGGALAVVGWRRARHLLDRVDSSAPQASTAPLPVGRRRDVPDNRGAPGAVHG